MAKRKREQDRLAALKGFDQLVAEHGLDQALRLLRDHWRARHAARIKRGRREIDDIERLVGMARHLLEDADLRERRDNRQSDRGNLVKSASRAIEDAERRDEGHPLDIVQGRIEPKAVRRLKKKFRKLPPIFALDTAGHGFDQGGFFL
jgi:hypothetical protein